MRFVRAKPDVFSVLFCVENASVPLFCFNSKKSASFGPRGWAEHIERLPLKTIRTLFGCGSAIIVNMTSLSDNKPNNGINAEAKQLVSFRVSAAFTFLAFVNCPGMFGPGYAGRYGKLQTAY